MKLFRFIALLFENYKTFITVCIILMYYGATLLAVASIVVCPIYLIIINA